MSKKRYDTTADDLYSKSKSRQSLRRDKKFRKKKASRKNLWVKAKKDLTWLED